MPSIETKFSDQGQPGNLSLSTAETNSMENKIVAVHRAFARANKTMTTIDRKLLITVLTALNWRKPADGDSVVLSLRELRDIFELNLPNDDLNWYFKDAFRDLMSRSILTWNNPDDKRRWRSIAFITEVASGGNGFLRVRMHPDLMPLFTDLVHHKSFLMMISSDLYKFRSVAAFALYDELRMHYDARQITNFRIYSVDELKKVLGFKSNAYMHVRPSGKTSFDRTGFEKRVLNPAIEDINQGKMLTIMPISGSEDKRFYRTFKQNGKLMYEFRFIVKEPVIENI